MKILAVDDEACNLMILEEMMENSPYGFTSTTSGSKALQILEDEPDITIILLDRMMPNMDGLEVIAAIRQRREWRNKAIIMQSASAADKDIIECTNAGAHFYLTKPYEEPTVMNILAAAIDFLSDSKK